MSEYPGKLLELGDPGPPPAGQAGNVDLGLAVVGGKVVMKLIPEPGKPVPEVVVFDPQNAFDFGEQLARSAHSAKFPGERPPDRQYLAQQIRARVTEQIREFLVGRAAMMLHSQREKKTVSNQKLAVQLVDQLLSALT